ncbi:hypothetical protein J7I84_07785 [Arthrobacter sp. ISL-85]|uniref:hypothetical protein n=1 Tax=Arthrobacter sp. ISL-85 TaxID=2819115 RepID=UPI001BEB684F|nr:hypothetical protein [Arthrobacter sp. ISL-85]
MLEMIDGLVAPADAKECVDKPEGAGQENAFTPGETVIAHAPARVSCHPAQRLFSLHDSPYPQSPASGRKIGS